MTQTALQALLLPPGGIILLLLLAFLLVRGVLGRMFLFLALVSLTLLSLPLVASKLMDGLETYPALRDGEPLPGEAQAILILVASDTTWAPEYGGEDLGEASLARLRYGAYLHRRTGLPVYVSAEMPANGRQVAALMAKVLRDDYRIEPAGVEAQGSTSPDGGLPAARMLRAAGVGRVLLVTSAYPMARAMDALQGSGVQPFAAPTGFAGRAPPDTAGGTALGMADLLPSMKALRQSRDAIGEHLRRAWEQARESGGAAQLRPGG